MMRTIRIGAFVIVSVFVGATVFAAGMKIGERAVADTVGDVRLIGSNTVCGH